MSSPVASLAMGLQRQMSGENEDSVFIDDAQRRAILRGVFNCYYADIHPTQLVIDASAAGAPRCPCWPTCIRRQADRLRAPHALDHGQLRAAGAKNALEPSGGDHRSGGVCGG